MGKAQANCLPTKLKKGKLAVTCPGYKQSLSNNNNGAPFN